MLRLGRIMPNTDFDPGKLSAFASHLAVGHPDRLHHYTGQSGLLGIVNRSELWATKAQYMNDATEFSFGLDLAEERIRDHPKRASDNNSGKLDHLFPRRSGIASVNIFVACFCEKPDLLSQWRGYSGETYGYSLAMHGTKLKSAAEKSGFSLAKCIYDRTRQIEIMDQLISHCLDIAKQGDMQTEFERGLLLVSAFFKDPTFVEEQEWRIVSKVKSITDKMVGFREGKSMLTPYFRVPIGEGSDSVLEAATVGPCPHMEQSQSATAMIFLRYGLAKTVNANAPGVVGTNARTWPEVYSSKVPYRNW